VNVHVTLLGGRESGEGGERHKKSGHFRIVT
jgi:hypothetical protein